MEKNGQKNSGNLPEYKDQMIDPKNKKNKSKGWVSSQMFDIRPVDKNGKLDIEKIQRIEKFVLLDFAYGSEKRSPLKESPSIKKIPGRKMLRSDFYHLEAERFQKVLFEEKAASMPENIFQGNSLEIISGYHPGLRKERLNHASLQPAWINFSLKELLFFRKYFASFPARKSLFSFSALAFSIFLIIFAAGLVNRGFKVKDSALSNSEVAMASLIKARKGMTDKNYGEASLNFNEAYENFSQISRDLDSLGGILVDATRFLPYLSKFSTGANLAKAGEDMSKAGALVGETMENLNKIKNSSDKKESISYLEVFEESNKNIKDISSLLSDADQHIEKINVSDIPEDKRAAFITLKEKLPEINGFLAAYNDSSRMFTDILGGNGPRKYLFLFQNNQEMRPTGGFIGTYAILDIFNGRVRNFYVDGIFNPDGQLRERVVPPGPIQKISVNWSLHDSNWFPDFPKSAEKACWFYEKTGGPTVDGVITMTPTVMQKLLEITGPIEMPEYEVTIDKDNFLETVQNEVEVDYDKELNQPKKILADLAPKILDRIFNAQSFSDIAKTTDTMLESLDEKHILIYSKNFEIEKLLRNLGWSGEVLDSQKDYLSIINTNINGYKTDGVVDETISHQAEIQGDGSIIDTVKITRRHNGGNTPYDWWNRVNADYMRIYVPEGSELVSVQGQTREANFPPLDYATLGYKNDPQLKMEEDSGRIDEESGTKIYSDSGKTVFANWLYVSPQETAEITYKYLLPFKIRTDPKTKSVDTYSVVYQKQSGSLGSRLISEISYPGSYKAIWKYPAEELTKLDNLPEGRLGFKMESDLATDKFIGAALVGNN